MEKARATPFSLPCPKESTGRPPKGEDRGLPLVAPLSKREECEGMSLALCSVGEVGSLAFPLLWRKAHAFSHRLRQRESKERRTPRLYPLEADWPLHRPPAFPAWRKAHALPLLCFGEKREASWPLHGSPAFPPWRKAHALPLVSSLEEAFS